MAIKSTDDLLFYEDNAQFPTESLQFVGLFQSKYCQAMKVWTNKSWIGRTFSRCPKRSSDIYEDAHFVAMAYVERHSGREILVNNIAALDGYGPTMYAALIQLAYDDKHVGVLPSQDPSKIVERAKRIWQRFSTDYPAKISLTPTGMSRHKESWLNNSYSLATPPLVDLDAMRNRYRNYLAYPDSNGQVKIALHDLAHALGQKSVDAHTTK